MFTYKRVCVSSPALVGGGAEIGHTQESSSGTACPRSNQHTLGHPGLKQKYGLYQSLPRIFALS